MPELMEMDVKMVLLGSGDAQIEAWIREWETAYPDKFAAHIGFVPALAHRIEAGADLFLMPSLFQPCGLNQLYSLRYGTLPVVSNTGGLADTVRDVRRDLERGVSLHESSRGLARCDAARNARRLLLGSFGYGVRRVVRGAGRFGDA